LLKGRAAAQQLGPHVRTRPGAAGRKGVVSAVSAAHAAEARVQGDGDHWPPEAAATAASTRAPAALQLARGQRHEGRWHPADKAGAPEPVPRGAASSLHQCDRWRRRHLATAERGVRAICRAPRCPRPGRQLRLRGTLSWLLVRPPTDSAAVQCWGILRLVLLQLPWLVLRQQRGGVKLLVKDDVTTRQPHGSCDQIKRLLSPRMLLQGHGRWLWLGLARRGRGGPQAGSWWHTPCWRRGGGGDADNADAFYLSGNEPGAPVCTSGGELRCHSDQRAAAPQQAAASANAGARGRGGSALKAVSPVINRLDEREAEGGTTLAEVASVQLHQRVLIRGGGHGACGRAQDAGGASSRGMGGRGGWWQDGAAGACAGGCMLTSAHCSCPGTLKIYHA
jgi:hypothetical protein